MYGLDDPNSPVDMRKLTASIMAHEGLRLKPYKDATGNTTIGYGRNLDGKGISTAEAANLLSDDIGDVILQAEAQTWWPVVKNDDVRARALVEIIFNIGLAGFNTFVKAIAALNDADFSTCVAEFKNSIWATQVGQRAIILTGMIETGEDPG
jgi:lysozyme